MGFRGVEMLKIKHLYIRSSKIIFKLKTKIVRREGNMQIVSQWFAVPVLFQTTIFAMDHARRGSQF